MIANIEQTPIAGATLSDIEKLASRFAEDYNSLRAVAAELQEELDKVKKKHLAALRRASARAKESQSNLAAAVELNPALFTRPRTQVFHGIKIGFTKGKGKMEIEDVDFSGEGQA